MVTTLSGLVGGLVATIVMTVFMMALGDDSPPPTAALWARYVGDGDPDQYMMQGIVLHLGYGTVAGGVFAVLVTAAGLGVGSLTAGLVAGIVWAAVLMIGGAVFWMRAVLGMDPGMEAMVMFGIFHLVYGVVLGAWVGLGVMA